MASTLVADPPAAKQISIAVDRGSPIPLYYQVAEQLARAIDEGELKPGDNFEKEVSLAERLELSRPTVRRSIAELVDRGLLVRRRGVGTTVAREIVHRRNELTSLFDDLAEAGQRPSTRLLALDRTACDRRAARALQRDPHTPLVYIERLRMVDGEPIAILKNWLPPSMANLSAAELEMNGLYALFRKWGIAPAVAHQSLGSRPPVAEEKEQLGLGRQDPVLTMVRTSYDAEGQALEFGEHCYRADRHRFDVTVHAS